MPQPTHPDLHALVGSRICHDLINPLGAIGNGIELLELSHVAGGEEMALVAGSVQNATAKLKFLRLAFGDATADQMCDPRELTKILADVCKDTRHNFDWKIDGAVARLDVRIALLSLMCIETALPLGGDIVVTLNDSWSVYARHERLNLDPNLWAPLAKGEAPSGLTAAKVHFGLLPQMASRSARTLQLTHGPDWVNIAF